MTATGAEALAAGASVSSTACCLARKSGDLNLLPFTITCCCWLPAAAPYGVWSAPLHIAGWAQTIALALAGKRLLTRPWLACSVTDDLLPVLFKENPTSGTVNSLQHAGGNSAHFVAYA